MKEAKKPLIVVCGKYGCGKTTAARAIQKELAGFHYIGIDETRQKMGLVPYRSEDNVRILEQMDLWVMHMLRDGFGVIVDRPHQTYESRARSYDAALVFENPILLVECVCPEKTAKARIAARPSSGTVHLPSNNPEITERIRRNWEDVMIDFERNPGLVSLLTYIRYFSNLPKTVPVSLTREIHDTAIRVCRVLDGIRPGANEKKEI
jgi:predicted kinase